MGFTSHDEVDSPTFRVPAVTEYCWDSGIDSIGYADPTSDWESNLAALRFTSVFGGVTGGPTSRLLVKIHDVTDGTSQVLTSVDNMRNWTQKLESNLTAYAGDEVWISIAFDPSLPDSGGWFTVSMPEGVLWEGNTSVTEAAATWQAHPTLRPCDYPNLTGSWPYWFNSDRAPADEITNGGFDKDLTGWTGGPGQPNPFGIYSVTTGNPFGGTSAMLGKPAVVGSGTSHIGQAFHADPTDHTLSLFYDNFCSPSRVPDYTQVVLTDMTAGTTRNVLPKTCVPDSGWTQATAAIIPGHEYMLDLYNVDEGPAGYTQFDDMTTW